MLTVDYLPAARRDFDESFDWYMSQSPQSAARFASAVDAAVLAVASDPVRFAMVDKKHRGCLVRRFPFRIIFRVVENGVVIVAVAHAKRRTGYWKGRA
jgi:plasmid stabilization system protein ParE